MTEHKRKCRCKSSECTELPKELEANTQVSLLIGNLQYDGTFLQAIDSVIQVRDPFEDSYIATPSIQTATIFPPLKSKCENKSSKNRTYQIECNEKAAVKTFRKILQNLHKTPVLVQVGSTILAGSVARVSHENL